LRAGRNEEWRERQHFTSADRQLMGSRDVDEPRGATLLCGTCAQAHRCPVSMYRYLSRSEPAWANADVQWWCLLAARQAEISHFTALDAEFASFPPLPPLRFAQERRLRFRHQQRQKREKRNTSHRGQNQGSAEVCARGGLSRIRARAGVVIHNIS
jgi:hypothetical protein